ncbi:MAG: methyltransferase domain-containing protein [Hydrogenophilaceae bacterium]
MDLFADEFFSLEEAAASGTAGRAPLQRTTGRDFAAIEFGLHWQSGQARHTDLHVANQLNLWRDWIPPELAAAVVDQPVGHSGTVGFVPGQLVPAYEAALCPTVEARRFERRVVDGRPIEPHSGRFYPKGLIAGVRDITSDDITPFRIGTIADGKLVADLNHPLADRPLTVTARILKAWQAGAQRGGTAQDVPEMITGKGPGMQTRWRDQATDFFTADAFARGRTEPDGEFYQAARLVDHLDRTATRQVEKLYARLLAPGARVLDLMTAWKSHLDLAQAGEVAGLGMNAEELAANPVLSERLLHDLNADPRLPYPDASFDAAVCTVSVEYLTRPFEVFAEVRRVLKPGGRFVVVFSNRYFPPKTIRVWAEAHPFERTGLVLEYFLRDGGYTGLNTFSLTGLFRPEDDKYASQTPWSDPIHAVWGDKV